MPLFRRTPAPEPRSLDELIEEAKGFVDRARPQLGPDEDLIPTLLADTRKGTELHALAVPASELEKALAKITRKVERFVFWATAWQAEGVTDGSVPASEHPDRFEVILLQASDPAAGRREIWRARLERVPGRAPRLGEWERMDTG